MKSKFTLIFSLLFFLFSCETSNCANGIQDGNETGVDCGGDCPGCLTVDVSNSPTFQAIQGTWFKQITTQTYKNPGEGSGTFDRVIVRTDPCEVELTNDASPTTGLPLTNYKMKGEFGYFCSFPEENLYSFDPDANTLNNYPIVFSSSDSLVLSSISESATSHDFYSRNPSVNSNSNTYTWELNLNQNINIDSAFILYIGTEDNTHIEYIRNNQLQYQGSSTVNPESGGYIGMRIVPNYAVLNAVETIVFSSEIEWNNLKASSNVHHANSHEFSSYEHIENIHFPSINWE